MKNLILLLPLILLSVLEDVAGQDSHKNSFKIDVGFIRFSKGNLNGLYFSNEFNKSINSKLELSPSVEISHGTTGNEFPYSLFNKTSIAGNFIAYYSPFSPSVYTKKINFRIGIGPSIRYFSGPNLSDYVIQDDFIIVVKPDSDYGVPMFHPIDRLKSHNFISAGAKATSSFQFFIFPRAQVGLNISYSKYLHGGNILTSGISFNYFL